MEKNFNLNNLNDMLFNTAKDYVIKYFIPLDNGMHCLLKNDSYEMFDHATIKKTFFDRMDIKLSKFYFKEYAGLKTIVYELGKPILYDDKLNLCHQFKHEYKLYDSYTPEIKEKVNIMLSFIKEVIASSSIPQYEYILKWFANIAHGNKNDSIFYMKGSQGIGKSTITQFLMQYVIGHKLSLETGAESLISKFNIELGGKLLVCFEELETLVLMNGIL